MFTLVLVSDYLRRSLQRSACTSVRANDHTQRGRLQKYADEKLHITGLNINHGRINLSVKVVHPGLEKLLENLGGVTLNFAVRETKKIEEYKARVSFWLA